jgi:hypothetical protein
MSENGEIPGLMRKYLNVFMFLRSSCFGSTVEEVKPFHGFESVDGLFEIIFVERT